MKDFKTTFFFMRLPLAVSLLGHGLVRLPKLTSFADGMVSSMESSILPGGLVLAFGYILPFIEAVLGLLLLLGYQTRYTLYGALALMGILILGSSTIENWGAVQAQLLHGIYAVALYWFWENKRSSTLDA